ncbi:MAG: tetratricopeptide repeat protein [Bdellovibrionaceae bacterium]|mgnify:FL=1|jgi:tetratricopeptide (TPR) repeat protein|nr:tetratricopeptide repeat protein [Pseudobdellovibrionaceae bacterium]
MKKLVKKQKLHIILMVILGLQMGCAAVSTKGTSLFRSEALHHLNPVPDNIAQPSIYKKGMVDPLYVQTQADFHFTMAETYSLDNQPAKAIEEYKLTLLYDPLATTVQLRLVSEYVKVGLFSEAITQSEKIVSENPNHKNARLILASLYSSLKMYKKALSEYDKILVIEPNHPEVPLFIGAIYAEIQEYDKAVKYFRKMAKSKNYKKTAHQYYYYIARIYLEQGEEYYKDAEANYQLSIGKNPKFEDAVIGLSKLYLKQLSENKAEDLLASYQDRFGPSRKVAKQLSQIYLSNEDYEKALGQLRIIEDYETYNLNIKVRIALILIETKKYRAAIRKLDRILLQAPESDKIRFYLGAVHEELKSYKAAITNYKRISPTSTYYPEAVIHISYMYKKTGEIDDASEVMEEAIKKRNDVAQFYSFYASLLDEKKQYKKAIVMLEKAKKQFPENTQIHFFLGSMYDRVGEKAKVAKQMSAVLEIDGEHIQALNYLAYTLAEKGDELDYAQELALKALGLKKNDGFILDTLGWIMFKKGDVGQSIKYLEAAYKQEKNESIIAEHLGDAYFNFQLAEKAKSMYIEAARTEKDVNKRRKIYEKIASIEKQVSFGKKRTPASVGDQGKPASKKGSGK